jgi:hypothetical protein
MHECPVGRWRLSCWTSTRRICCKWPRPTISSQSRHSARTVRSQRSACSTKRARRPVRPAPAATIPAACWHRNARQDLAAGRGAGPAHGGTGWCGSPWPRGAHQGGAARPGRAGRPTARVLVSEADDQQREPAAQRPRPTLRTLHATPRHLRGRTLSLATSGLMLANGLGFAAAGAAAEFATPQTVIVASGLGGLLAVALRPAPSPEASGMGLRCRPVRRWASLGRRHPSDRLASQATHAPLAHGERMGGAPLHHLQRPAHGGPRLGRGR